MDDINSIIQKSTKIIRTFDLMTYDDLKYLPHLAVAARITNKCITGSTKLFSIKLSDNESVLVSYDIIMYFFDKNYVRFNTNISEEQMFQNSTKTNYGNLSPESLPYLREMIELLEHLWK